MKSIIQIVEDVIIIGDSNDSSIIEVRKIDCNFEPQVGDQVNVFNNDKRLIVTKIEAQANPLPDTSNINDKIHINIVNDNSRNNDVPALSPYQKNVVGKIPYILLALFLGGFGAHKFYAGKIGLGILYLVFCWTYIPSIIAFIEMIIACCKTSDSNGRIIV